MNSDPKEPRNFFHIKTAPWNPGSQVHHWNFFTSPQLHCPICSERLHNVRPIDHFNQELSEYLRSERIKSMEDDNEANDFSGLYSYYNNNGTSASQRHQIFLKIRSNRNKRTGMTIQCPSPGCLSSQDTSME